MYKQEQTMAKTSASTLSKLDKLRNLLALLIIKNGELVRNYRDRSSHISFEREELLISSFVGEMEKELLRCLNETQDLYNGYNKQQVKGEIE